LLVVCVRACAQDREQASATAPFVPNYKTFWLFRYIVFSMYLDMCISMCIVKATYLEKPKRLISWDELSR